nr:MAG TPA: hypothetical protein [Crassvirales sp.]
MVNRKIDGCKTTIIKSTRYFHINTKLFLTEKEKTIINTDYLSKKLSKEIYEYERLYGEKITAIGFGYEIDKSDSKNWKILRDYIVLETYLSLEEYRKRLIIVNNQQRYMKKVKEILKQIQLSI